MTAALSGSVTTEQRVERNEGTVIGFALTQIVRGLLQHHRLDATFVQQQTRTFVRPSAFDQVEDTLERHRVAVLLGERDRGLHHAAVHLLGTRPSVRPREVRREPGTHVDPAELLIDDEVGLLLDMRREADVDPALGRGLADIADRLADRRSFLVVLGAERTWSRARPGAEHLIHILPAVAAVDIVRQRIEAEHPNLDVQPYLKHPRVQELLRLTSPSEAVEWARDLVRVTDMSDLDVIDAAGDDGDDLSRRVHILIAMRSSWRERLLELHKSTESRERNFLLAAAVLERSKAGVVFRAASSLAVALGEEAPAAAGQQGPGLIELCDVVNAELSRDDRLAFRVPGFAEAAIDYFWLDRQHLRDLFLRWLIDLPGPESDPSVAKAVAERVAPLILRRAASEQTPPLIRDAASRWAVFPHLRKQAAQLLLAASLDNDLGKDIRQAILSWARQQDSALKLVLAEVCSGDLADLRPREALYRLGALAESRDPAVVAAVSAGLGRLWRTDLRGPITRLVGQWCGSDQIESARLTGASVFMSLCTQADDDDAAAEFARVTPDDVLGSGWSAVLDTQPTTAATAALAPWLDDVVNAPGPQDRVVTVLGAAVRGRGINTGSRATSLAKVLFAWQPLDDDHSRPDRAALRDRLHDAAVRQVPEVNTLLPSVAPNAERIDRQSITTSHT